MFSERNLLWSPKYRPDIDGLRALAVLGVVGFHAFPSWVSGGFIGVDIFFVISGYLVSTIIIKNMEGGVFNISDFYARRIKRIFPALILVMITFLACGWFALLADEYEQLGKHIAASSAFISNIVYLDETGYFDNSAETKPLLHLWSLGIEEQFYVFFPILVFICWKYKLNLLISTLSIGTASFLLNIEYVEKYSIATFYSPLTRIWELLSGSLLAYLMHFKHNNGIREIAGGFTQKLGLKKILNTTSLIGLIILIYGIFFINSKMIFPGATALIPVIGTSLLIASGSNAWANTTIFSKKIPMWFGKISFPLYLWHWPLLSYGWIIEGSLPSRHFRFTVVVLSIVLAWLTYILIEFPIRFGKHRDNIKIVRILITLMVLVGTAGYTIYANNGFKFRDNNVQHMVFSGDIGHLEYYKFTSDNYPVCTEKNILKHAEKWRGYVRCNQSKADPNIDIALIGDSHAEQLFIGLAENIKNKNIAYYTRGGGAPFISNPAFKEILHFVATNSSIKQVIVSAHWMSRYKQVPPNSTFENEILLLVDMLLSHGKTVYIVNDNPRFTHSPKACNGGRWPTYTLGDNCKINANEMTIQRNIFSTAIARVVTAKPSINVIDIGKHFCSEEFCSMVTGNNILYRDEDHLNLNGTRYVGTNIVKEFPELSFGY